MKLSHMIISIYCFVALNFKSYRIVFHFVSQHGINKKQSLLIFASVSIDYFKDVFLGE